MWVLSMRRDLESLLPEKVILTFALKDRSQVRGVRDKINEKGESVDCTQTRKQVWAETEVSDRWNTKTKVEKTVETPGTLYILHIFSVSEPGV